MHRQNVANPSLPITYRLPVSFKDEKHRADPYSTQQSKLKFHSSVANQHGAGSRKTEV